MNRPKILVTGATGRTGAAVVSELLNAGYPVRAMVRREDVRAAALRAKGVDIAVAEITDMGRVSAAMRGVQRAYWLPPYDPAMLTGATVFATAAREARLEAIVSLRSEEHTSELQSLRHLVCRLLLEKKKKKTSQKTKQPTNNKHKQQTHKQKQQPQQSHQSNTSDKSKVAPKNKPNTIDTSNTTTHKH